MYLVIYNGMYGMVFMVNVSVSDSLHMDNVSGSLSLSLFLVLLYVRREEEEVFDALMLNTPTLSGLLQAVSVLTLLRSHRKYACSLPVSQSQSPRNQPFY